MLDLPFDAGPAPAVEAHAAHSAGVSHVTVAPAVEAPAAAIRARRFDWLSWPCLKSFCGVFELFWPCECRILSCPASSVYSGLFAELTSNELKRETFDAQCPASS